MNRSIFIKTMNMRTAGPSGPDSGPEHPFPLKLGGFVTKGFGRGKVVRAYFTGFLSSCWDMIVAGNPNS